MATDDDPDHLGPAREHDAAPHATVTIYSVTVTTPGSGRVQTVQVPARSPGAAFPIACAWFPLLPLTGARVEIEVLGPEPHAGATPR